MPRPSSAGSVRWLALAGALAAGWSASASAGSVAVQYGISLAGIPLGTATLEGQIDGARYQVTVGAKLTGLATVVTNGRGSARAAGALASGRVLSGGYALTAANSQMTRTIQMGMTGGNITAVKIEPPFDERPDRVLVTDAHRRNVVDPVSALIMPMLSAEPLAQENCSRTLPVFDGAQRFDIELSPAGTHPIAGKGAGGQALVCRARYIPVSGHRPNREATKFMQNNREMEVWLVPVDGARVLMPYRIAVKTMIGTSVIEAQKISGAGGN